MNRREFLAASTAVAFIPTTGWAELPQTGLPELLPWHWETDRQQELAA